MGGPATEEMRVAFGRALDQAMREADINPPQLAKELTLHPDAVRKWLDGKSEPKHALTAFAAERLVGLGPGDLSHHLGFVPAGQPPSVSAAIEAAAGLSPGVKQSLLAAYRAGRRG